MDIQKIKKEYKRNEQYRRTLWERRERWLRWCYTETIGAIVLAMLIPFMFFSDKSVSDPLVMVFLLLPLIMAATIQWIGISVDKAYVQELATIPTIDYDALLK